MQYLTPRGAKEGARDGGTPRTSALLRRARSQQDTPAHGNDAPGEGAVSVHAQARLPLIRVRDGCTGEKVSRKKPVTANVSRTAPPPPPQRPPLPVPIVPVPAPWDATMAPWGGPSLSESSFTAILPPPPPPPPPPAPPLATLSPPPSAAPHTQDPGRGGGSHGPRRKPPPRARPPRVARLPPLRPVTALSFSPPFTFSFFSLPQHQSPRGRAERERGLQLLLRQIQY